MSGIIDCVTSLVPRTTGYVTSLVPRTDAEAHISSGNQSCYQYCYGNFDSCPTELRWASICWPSGHQVTFWCC